MATDVEVVRRRFTVDEYHQMARAGILNEDARVELIRGEMVHQMVIGSRHAAGARPLNEPVGAFRLPERVARGGTLTPLAFPDTPLAAADVLDCSPCPIPALEYLESL